MSIASRIFLAAAFAAVLWFPGGAQAAVQGFSIDLGDRQDPLTLDYNPAGGLSAEAAASNGQPAKELKNNGSYKATLTGNYDVVDNLGSLDKNKPVFGRGPMKSRSNGHLIFGSPAAIVGPYRARIFGSRSSLSSTRSRDYPPPDLSVIIAVLEHFDSFSVNSGEFDCELQYLKSAGRHFRPWHDRRPGVEDCIEPPRTLCRLPSPSSSFRSRRPGRCCCWGSQGLGCLGYRQTRRAKPQTA